MAVHWTTAVIIIGGPTEFLVVLDELPDYYYFDPCCNKKCAVSKLAKYDMFNTKGLYFNPILPKRYVSKIDVCLYRMSCRICAHSFPRYISYMKYFIVFYIIFSTDDSPTEFYRK